jgi:hypothetical protein
MLGLQEDTVLASSTVFGHPIGGRNTGNLFFHHVLRKTSAVHLLLGYKYVLVTKSMCPGSENLMAPSKRLMPYFETGNDKFKMAAAKTECTCISASILDSKEITMANSMFSGSGNSLALLAIGYALS